MPNFSLQYRDIKAEWRARKKIKLCDRDIPIHPMSNWPVSYPRSSHTEIPLSYRGTGPTITANTWQGRRGPEQSPRSLSAPTELAVTAACPRNSTGGFLQPRMSYWAWQIKETFHNKTKIFLPRSTWGLRSLVNTGHFSVRFNPFARTDLSPS